MATATRSKRPAAGSAPAPPERLPWTGDEVSDRLIAADPTALIIGFVLDQQVTVQKAFSGPRAILDRLGTLDPAALADLDADTLVEAFRRPPAIHRFPASMAGRVQAVCRHLADTYGGDPSRIWTEAADGADLARRLGRLAGFGEMKVRTVMALLARQYGVRPAGVDPLLPGHPTLADVTTPEELERYQAGKRAYKASLRAQGLDPRATARAQGQDARAAGRAPGKDSRATGRARGGDGGARRTAG